MSLWWCYLLHRPHISIGATSCAFDELALWNQVHCGSASTTFRNIVDRENTFVITGYSVGNCIFSSGSFLHEKYLLNTFSIYNNVNKMFNSVSRIESESKQTFYKHLLSYF